MGGVEHGLRVFANRQIQQVFHFAASCNIDCFPITGQELDHFQRAFRNRPRFIAEQDIQGARRFNTFRFSDKHVMVKHFLCILHQHK